MGNPFRGETITQVSSAIYNLAGDTSKMESFIKKTIFQSIFLSEGDFNLSQNITSAILTSHGFSLRHYIYWLTHNNQGSRYKELVGYKSSEISLASGLNEQNLGIILKPSTDRCVYILDSDFGTRIPSWWAGIYIEKYASQYEGYPFKVSMSEITEDAQHHEIQTMTITFTPPDDFPPFDVAVQLPYQILPLCRPDTNYIYAKYQTYLATDEDGDNVDDIYYAQYQRYQQEMAQWGEDGPAPIEPVNPIDYLYEIDIFGNYVRDPSDIKYLIYEQGSNPSSPLETLFPNKTSFPTDQAVLVPPIPFRLNNLNLSQIFADDKNFDESLKERIRNFKEHHDIDEISDLYQTSKKAFNKAYSVNGYKKLDNVILTNKKLGDIDYAYLFFGVSLNTLRPEGKEYLYHFFKNLHNLTADSFNSPNGFFVKANKEPLNFSYTITWNHSSYFVNVKAKKEHSFLKKAKFDKNKKYTTLYASKKIVIPVKVTVDNEVTYIEREITVDQGVYFIKKNKNNTYDYVVFFGLKHENYVYDYESVVTTAKDAFSLNKNWDGKTEYEESAFIVPIHMGIFKSLSSLVQAELGESFAYMIFNCYERKRLKWYETKSFSSFFMWVSCVTFFLTWGWSAGVQAGLKTTQAALQAGTITYSEIIAKALISKITMAVGAIAVSKIITMTLAPSLGIKWASIVGSIAAFSTALYLGGAETLSQMFEALTQAKNLIALGLSTLDGYSRGLAGETQQMVRQGQQELETLKAQYQSYMAQYNEEFSTTTDWAKESIMFRQGLTGDGLFHFSLRTGLSPDGYFYFTLPRGAEIAERTLDYTLNYPEYSTRPYLATE